jgi:hypothetical protein
MTLREIVDRVVWSECWEYLAVFGLGFATALLLVGLGVR